ncbi:hypothetical protein [Nostoc sp. PCC 9305]|uniref:hypothetical protein n=1 Tax=Nostoc sp. PCC 9305 TaxID=296636 RepID=UPI0039C5CADB
MNSEKKQNIDEIINHFLASASNNGKIDEAVLNHLIDIKKLALEEQKNRNEQEIKREENIIKVKQNRFPNNILSNPITPPIIAAFAGFLTSTYVAYVQGDSNLKLEQLKYQSELIANSTQSEDPKKRTELLKFNIDAGLIRDPYILSKLESLIQKGDVPQSYVSQILDPNKSILPKTFPLPTVSDFKGSPGCYIAAYSRQKIGHPVGNNVYVVGQVRVRGHYEGKNCEPKGYEGKKIDSLDDFKKFFDQKLPQTCKNKNCWAGKETGGFLGN